MGEMVKLIEGMIALGWLYQCECRGVLHFTREDDGDFKAFADWEAVAKFIEEEMK